MNREFDIKRLFAKKSSYGVKALFLLAFSLGLFFCDRSFHCFDSFRSGVSLAALPINDVINWPTHIVRSLAANFASKQDMVEENSRLASELLLINTKLQQLEFLEKENSELRTLLYGSKQIKQRSLAAELVKLEAGNLGQGVTINRGKQYGVYLGQPVLDAYGLYGQVIFVGDKMSKVLLVTNSKSAIPVMVVRNGLQTIALGMGHGNSLKLANVPETADIKVGDVLVTSKLGQLFPAGYLVGVVKNAKSVRGERFMKIEVIPKAHVSSGQHVLLVWPDLAKNLDQVARVSKKGR